MKTVVVLSDTHRNLAPLDKISRVLSECDYIIHLGDMASDARELARAYPEKTVVIRGNNDFYCNYPKKRIILENNIKIYITHGHYEYVKSGLGHLLDSAKAEGCSLALYGHTHRQQADYADSVHLFCPGALMNGEYGVVDITDNGLICIGMKI